MARPSESAKVGRRRQPPPRAATGRPRPEKTPGAGGNAQQPMTGEQYRKAVGQLGLSVYASARAIVINLRTAQRYAAGESVIPPYIAKLVRALVALGRIDV
jgi:hypothetical protein